MTTAASRNDGQRSTLEFVSVEGWRGKEGRRGGVIVVPRKSLSPSPPPLSLPPHPPSPSLPDPRCTDKGRREGYRRVERGQEGSRGHGSRGVRGDPQDQPATEPALVASGQSTSQPGAWWRWRLARADHRPPRQLPRPQRGPPRAPGRSAPAARSCPPPSSPAAVGAASG